MRRSISVFLFFLFALPAGFTLSGCGHGSSATFCSGSVGPQTGTAQSIVLQPQIGGISLGFSQIGSVTTPTAVDCKNNPVTIAKYTYATVDPNNPLTPAVADVNPTTGSICAGQWNRNTPGGTPDFTFCTPTGKAGVAELTAAGGGANSNKVEVYVHPQITSVTLASPSTCEQNADKTLKDPATNCYCGASYNGVTLTAPNCYQASTAPSAGTSALDTNSCLQFNHAGLLATRFFAIDPTTQQSTNITLSAGHATYTAQTAGLVTFNNDTGVATALAPGTTVVTATIANSTSTAGLISVCPPASITITTPNAANGAVTVNANNTEPITAVVTDAFGNSLTGLSLTYNSSTPVSIPASSTGITPVFPGSAAINAYCLPPTCNPSPFGNVGLLGTGKPIISNTLTANTPGNNSTRLWIGSTDSIYLVPVDLTTGAVPSPTRLPYTPNSMILSQNGATIFMGSDSAIMTFSTATNAVLAADITIQGKVLAVSPDSATAVVTDPARKLVYLYNTGAPASGTGSTATAAVPAGVVTTFAGVGTRAAYSPDASTVYITTTDNRLLVFSTFTGWSSYDLSATGANDVAITEPHAGAFVSGATGINGRSYCPNSTVSPTVFFPQASTKAVSASVSDRLATTNDSKHLLDVRLAASGGSPIVNDLALTIPGGACPTNGTVPAFTVADPSTVTTGITTTAVTGVFPASDSSIAAVTYLPSASATAGASLPIYTPATSGAGTVKAVTLSGAATAPVFGVFASDNKTFFVGTSGDNQVHLIDTTTRTAITDKSQIAPKLPSNATNGGIATPNLIVQYPRTVTNQ